MSIITDLEIENYLNEKKYLEKGSSNPPNLIKRAREYRKTQKIKGKTGTKYLLTIRKAINYDNNFCIIFSLALEDKEQFILTRYNGNWHRHKNKIEKNIVSGFHIHITTERYQRAGHKCEGFAKASSYYSDWKSGYKRVLQDLNIMRVEDKSQRSITKKYKK